MKNKVATLLRRLLAPFTDTNYIETFDEAWGFPELDFDKLADSVAILGYADLNHHTEYDENDDTIEESTLIDIENGPILHLGGYISRPGQHLVIAISIYGNPHFPATPCTCELLQDLL